MAKAMKTVELVIEISKAPKLTGINLKISNCSNALKAIFFI